MIPLSSRIDKYRRIMEKKEKTGKPCDILQIVKRDDSRESVFLIQDMFPITEEYIEREYTIAGNHLMLAWYKVYPNATGCYGDTGEIERVQVVFPLLVY